MQNAVFRLEIRNLMDLKQENRELYYELGLLINGISQVFSLTENETSKELENGTISLKFKKNGSGDKYIIAKYNGQSAELFFDPPNKIRAQLIPPQ
jgi:hypothetical protein